MVVSVVDCGVFGGSGLVCFYLVFAFSYVSILLTQDIFQLCYF